VSTGGIFERSNPCFRAGALFRSMPPAPNRDRCMALAQMPFAAKGTIFGSSADSVQSYGGAAAE
jgi:hypothetical protein